MTTKKQLNDTITIKKEEYHALLQIARVTSEYMKGKKEKFESANDLIANLKNL